MAVIQPRPAHIMYQCAKIMTIGRHLTSFSIFWYFISRLLVEISV